MKASVGINAKIIAVASSAAGLFYYGGVRGDFVSTSADSMDTTSSSKHACQKCTSVEVYEIKEWSWGITNDIPVFAYIPIYRDAPLNLGPFSLSKSPESHRGDYYYSSKNHIDSIHKNTSVLGEGKCPNLAYRTTIDPHDHTDRTMPTAIYTIRKSSGDVVRTGRGKFSEYLHPSEFGAGTYTASATSDSYRFGDKSFTVTDRAQTVVIEGAVLVTGVELDAKDMEITMGSTGRLTATVLPLIAADKRG